MKAVRQAIANFGKFVLKAIQGDEIIISRRGEQQKMRSWLSGHCVYPAFSVI
jgi:hypothetical protein